MDKYSEAVGAELEVCCVIYRVPCTTSPVSVFFLTPDFWHTSTREKDHPFGWKKSSQRVFVVNNSNIEMKSFLFLIPAVIAVQVQGDFPISLPAELFSDVNKGPHPAVNVFMEADNGSDEGKQIQVSQQLAAHYGNSQIQRFNARQNYRARQSFLKGSPGAASVGGISGGAGEGSFGGSIVGGSASAGAMVNELAGLLDRIGVSSGGGQSAGVPTSTAATGTAPLSQEMMAKQAKINSNLEAAAIMHSDAEDVWADSAEKSLKKEIRAAMKSSPPKTTTLGKVRAAIFGGSHATSFLSPQSAKISAAELQQIAQDVTSAVNSQFSAPRVNSKCETCSSVNFEACPATFAAGGNGVCTPTQNYHGFCNRPFLNLGSELEKQEYEYLCDTCYPCSG